jgi:hypothetical protein
MVSGSQVVVHLRPATHGMTAVAARNPVRRHPRAASTTLPERVKRQHPVFSLAVCRVYLVAPLAPDRATRIAMLRFGAANKT